MYDLYENVRCKVPPSVVQEEEVRFGWRTAASMRQREELTGWYWQPGALVWDQPCRASIAPFGTWVNPGDAERSPTSDLILMHADTGQGGGERSDPVSSWMMWNIYSQLRNWNVVMWNITTCCWKLWEKPVSKWDPSQRKFYRFFLNYFDVNGMKLKKKNLISSI